MRIAAIRSWAYIAQRPDWVLAREEMAARARAAEARLSDALHARLTERFVNRRTSVLMKKLGADAALLPVRLEGDEVQVDGEPIGHLAGFRFRVDPQARLADRKLLLAAAERHLPELRAARAAALLAAVEQDAAVLTLSGAALAWDGEEVARLIGGRSLLAPRIRLDPALDGLGSAQRQALETALERWLGQALGALAPLRRIEAASSDPGAGAELRALLIRLVEAGGLLVRAKSGIEHLSAQQRKGLARLGVRVGALDLYVPEMLRFAALTAWRTLLAARGVHLHAPVPGMPPVIALPGKAQLPPGYRQLGRQGLRLDMADKLLRAAHEVRLKAGGKSFVLDPALAISTGLSTAAYALLLKQGGFVVSMPRPLAEGEFGPPRPPRWRWKPVRKEAHPAMPRFEPRPGNAFAALAEILR